jgi:ATP-dependent DNA helicase RecQ
VASDIEAEAQALLQELTGQADARFRPDQIEAIQALVVDRRRVLLVQRTGWGKSAVYFIATRLLRRRGAGPTLLVSPLLALMRNQIEAAARMGIRAATVNSQNRDEWGAIQHAVDADEIDILLISAQRLANDDFRSEVLPLIGRRGGLLVVDEAHCISDWGHDFNPDYRRITRVLDLLPDSVPVLGCTATANDRVVADVTVQLGADLAVFRGPLGRSGLELSVLDLPAQADRLAWLVTYLPQLPGSGIVYCLTKADVERTADWLVGHGISALPYSGATEGADRERAERALLDNEVKVLVATSALGMGFDKPDLGFVVHYQSPGSPIAYYQQVGRAGRQLERSLGILLRGHEDTDIQDWFITSAFPPEADTHTVLDALEQSDRAMTVAQLESVANLSRGRLTALLKVLEVEGAVERSGGRYQRTADEWHYDHERIEGITALRRAEQQAMLTFATTAGCRMQLLGEMLDDPEAAPCGICDTCTGRPTPCDLDPALVAEAHRHLRSGDLVIEPRKKWPPGTRSPATIAAGHQVAAGRALSRWGDGGWGPLVAEGRRLDTPLDEAVVDGCVALIRSWAPQPVPTWVAFVPSLRHPRLVADLAARIAAALDLPVHDVVQVVGDHRPQRDLHNSSQQVTNVIDAFSLGGPVPAGAALLVDDLIDSRWTITVVGSQLRAAGCAAVHPFALATMSPG